MGPSPPCYATDSMYINTNVPGSKSVTIDQCFICHSISVFIFDLLCSRKCTLTHLCASKHRVHFYCEIYLSWLISRCTIQSCPGFLNQPAIAHKLAREEHLRSHGLARACRGLMMPGATAWLYSPVPNSSNEKSKKCRHLKYVKPVLMKNKFRKIKPMQHVWVALQHEGESSYSILINCNFCNFTHCMLPALGCPRPSLLSTPSVRPYSQCRN